MLCNLKNSYFTSFFWGLGDFHVSQFPCLRVYKFQREGGREDQWGAWKWLCDLRANERPQNKLHPTAQTEIQTDIWTDRRTWRLYDWIGPLGQCGTNIRILEYIRIYLDKYIHSSQYSLNFFKANIFGYSFVIYLYWEIYSEIHLSNIYDSKYIWIFSDSKQWLKMVFIGPKWFNMSST